MTARPGVALLAVLWLITGATAIAMTVVLGARERIRTSANRATLARSEWSAEDCLARARSALDELLVRRPTPFAAMGVPPAESLPILVARSREVGACPGAVRLAPVGMSLELGALTAEVLRRALAFQRLPRPVTDSLVDAFLDWRDTDDVARPHGCEHACYDALRREPPRNGPFASASELRLVRGFDRWDSLAVTGVGITPLDDLFSVEHGRVAITWAPLAVLAALPGLGESGAREIVAQRSPGVARFHSLAAVGQVLSPATRDSFALSFVTLEMLATVTPDAWLLTVTAPRQEPGAGLPSLGSRLVVRLILGANGAQVIRRTASP